MPKMGFKKVLEIGLDGIQRVKLRFEKKIIRPQFAFEDEIEEAIWELAMEESILPLLKEEMREARKGQRRKDVKYLFKCPYCSFKSEFFYCIDLHMAYNESCYRWNQKNPWYPINLCIHKPTGQQFIP